MIQSHTKQPAEAGRPDASLLQSQLAAFAENDADGELRPFLEFLRVFLNARAVAVLPVSNSDCIPACVVTSKGISSGGVAQLASKLDFGKAIAQPARSLGEDAWTLAVPVRRENAPLCWFIAQLSIPNPRDVQAFLVLLQTAAGFLLYRAQRGVTRDLNGVVERTSSLLDLFQRAGGELDFEKASRIAVDDLRDYIGCSRVFFAAKRRGSLHVRAISGMGRIDAKSAANHPFEAAMSEALILKKRVDFSVSEPKRRSVIAHEILLQQTGAAQITTLPLPRESGALLLEWKSAPTQRESLLVDAIAPFAPVLFDLIERARPNAAVFFVRRAWRKANAKCRAAIVGAAFVVGALLAWPFHYSVKADCRLAPTVKRVVAAPFQGQLRKSFVQPGDRVIEGQPLAEMDNRDLKMKEAELSASRDRAIKQRDKAMSKDGNGPDPAAAQVANLEAQSVGQELELVQRKIALLAVKSPLAGAVVAGDLRRSEGQPVQQGQVLFEVAPLDEMIVEIDVPDREVSRVRAAQKVAVRLESFAGEAWATAVAKIHPQSEQREGRNVFVAEAAIASKPARDLRPGMRGRAIIETDRHPLAWIVGHRFWDFIVESIFW